jgi:hypothetical protein
MNNKTKKSFSVKYRLIVIKENERGSWREIEWEGYNKLDTELDKKYCRLLGKKTQDKNAPRINGKNSLDDKVLDVHVQIGKYDGFSKKYKWEDHDFRCSSEENHYHMR